MSFDLIKSRHKQDPDFPQRTYDLSVLMSILDGSFYSVQPFQNFHEDLVGGRLISLLDRRPNLLTGTMEIRTQITRHVSMLFGDHHFPTVETENAATRKWLKDWAKESELAAAYCRGAFMGAVGSVAFQLKALSAPGTPLRMWVEAHATAYLTPEFDPFNPQKVTAMVFKKKFKGSDLVAQFGFKIAKDELRKHFFFMIRWDDKGEWWFDPWLVSKDREARAEGKVYKPHLNDQRSITHDHGFCPWDWVAAPGLADGIDGDCAFQAALEPAISKDFHDSFQQLLMRYNMSPTLVISSDGEDETDKPIATVEVAGAGEGDGMPGESGGNGAPSGLNRGAGSIVEVEAKAKVYYAEISGESAKAAKEHSEVLRKQIIEAIHGDRVDPAEVTNGHQGSKSLEMLNNPMLMYVSSLQTAYGASLMRVYRMALAIVKTQNVKVLGKIVDKAVKDEDDMFPRWPAFYVPTPAENTQEANGLMALTGAGILSRETSTTFVAKIYGIENVQQELAKITAEQAAEDARAERVAKAEAAQAQAKSSENITSG